MLVCPHQAKIPCLTNVGDKPKLMILNKADLADPCGKQSNGESQGIKDFYYQLQRVPTVKKEIQMLLRA